MSKILAAAFFAAAFSIPHADVIVTGGGSSATRAVILDSPAAVDQQITVPIHNMQQSDTAAMGGARNITTFDFSLSGSTGYLRADFDYTAFDANLYTEANNQAQIFFTITGTESVRYTMSGDFTTSGSVATFSGALRSGKSILFENFQTNNNSPGETLVLGETEGDYGNTMINPAGITGFLAPGAYNWVFNVNAFGYPGERFAASGFEQIYFGEPATSSVPEPGTMALLGLGLAGLALSRKRK